MSYYTNPAFCEQSEFYPQTNEQQSTSKQPNTLVKTQRSASMRSISRNARTAQPTQFELQLYHQNQQKQRQQQQKIQQRELPPKPGPKPIQFNIKAKFLATNATSTAVKCQKASTHEGYALVPLDELPSTSKGRYAILPTEEADMIRGSSMRLTKSQDNLDSILNNTTMDFSKDEESFTSLPPMHTQQNDHDHDDDDEHNNKLVSAFSSDFINKSMILVDQHSMQRYAIVPTDDDEEMVDSNHEIIQMHNGRAHRYAVIPTDEEETCLSGEFETNSRSNYQALRTNAVPIGFATPPKVNAFASNAQKVNAYGTATKQIVPKLHQNVKTEWTKRTEVTTKRVPETPTKNPIATQKLHELLSTPRKTQQESLQRHNSYQTIIQRSPNRYQSQILYTTQKRSEFTPQKLQYDMKKIQAQTVEQRTTAVISPRLQQSIYNETTLSSEMDKTWPHESFVKVENATATIGVISLMLILTGVMNSGLCLYMVTDVSR